MPVEKSIWNRAAAAFASRFCLWCSHSLLCLWCFDSLPQMEGRSDFNRLDEGCVAHILSFTSPRDVCRLSAVSRKFKAAAESEVLWQRFLPSDWWQLIRRSVSALHFASKRDLFFCLSKSILIDDCRWRLWLEKSSGKKCWLVSPRVLNIVWGDDTRYWQWITASAESRSSVFPEVAELKYVWWFDVCGTFDMADLSPNTMYAVRFLVGHTQYHIGWSQVTLSFRVGDDPLMLEQNVCLDPGQLESALRPSKEHQGWMYVQVGEFFSNAGGGRVEFRMHEHKGVKTGILIAGVELSPCSSDPETRVSSHQEWRESHEN